MKDYIVRGIVGDLKVRNLQNNMRKKGNFKKFETLGVDDYRLARAFYEFLNEETDRLPSFEFIDYVVGGFSDDKKLISCHGGVNVYFSNNYSSEFKIEYDEPITPNNARIEVITDKEHYAYTSPTYFVDNIVFGKLHEIDLSLNKRFDENRVKFLQKYLSDYFRYLNSDKIKRK